MPTLKVRCPECDTSIRQSIDAVDEPTEVSINCPKCGSEFQTIAEPPTPSPKQPKKKSLKATQRQDEDEDEDDRPQSKKKKRKGEEDEYEDRPQSKKKRKGEEDEDEEDEDDEKPASNKAIIFGAIGGGVLLIACIVGGVLAFGGSKDKGNDVAKTDPPQVNSGTGSGTGQGTGPGPQQTQGNGTNPGPTGSGTNTGTNGPTTGPSTDSTPPNTSPTDSTPPNTGPTAPTTGPTGPVGPKPKPKTPANDAFIPKLPPPPILRLHGDETPTAGTLVAVEKHTPTPPLSPDEDPFVRAKGFRAEGALPPLPKLLPPNQRPVLALDSGGHSAIISNTFITPKGDRVVTVAADKTVRIWDVKTGESLNTIRLPAGPGEEGSLLAAALSPNGKRLAVSGTPLKSVKQGAIPIFILNVETGALQKTISTATAEVQSLDFSSEGNRVVAGCDNGMVQLFDANTGAQVDKVQAHAGGIREVRFNPLPKSRVLATLGGDRTVRIWDLGNASRNAALKIPRGLNPTTLGWSNDGRSLAVGTVSGELLLFSVADGGALRVLPKHTHKGISVGISQLQYLAGDREIVCGGSAGWTGVVSLDTGKTKVAFNSHTNTVSAVNASSDGKLAVTSGGNQHETYVWNTTDGKVVSRLCGVGKGMWGIGWSKDGKSIGWGSVNKVNDADGNCPLEEIFRLDDMGPGGPAFQTKFQQSLKTDETFSVVQLSKTEIGIMVGKSQPYGIKLQNEPVYSTTVLPNRGMVVIGTAQSLYLLDPQTYPKTKQMTRTFVGNTGHTLSIAPSPDGKFFVTGSSDQTIRIWQPELAEPILSIFVAGREWIAWTSEGFYACSPHGERLLAWQINNTAYKSPAIHPAARFRTSLYQPALIKYLIPAGTLQNAMAMAEKFDKALVRTSSVSEIVPPEVAVEGLKEEGVVDQDVLTIKATAKGSVKYPITSMRLLVDGRPFQGAKGIKRFPTPSETAEVTWDVPLTPGPHSFAVIADTPISKGMSRPATVTRSGVVPKPNLYVLAMGVSAYPDGMKLNYAASDALLLSKTLQAKCTGVFANIEVRVLTDKDATKKGIQDGLDWLGSKMTAKDVGIVSFSGHGTRDPEGRFYLVPVDISKADPFNTCFSGEEFKTRLDAMPGRLVAILDACHSGEVAEKAPPPSRADSLVRDLAAEDSGVVVMCASLGREYAIESRASKAGFFTLGLVEGLSGYGDVDGDGVIYINELDTYAYARVHQLSAGQQNPTTALPPGIRPFPLATVTKTP